MAVLGRIFRACWLGILHVQGENEGVRTEQFLCLRGYDQDETSNDGDRELS